MQQDKQGTTMNTISQRTANKFIPETLTLSGELAIVFLDRPCTAQYNFCIYLKFFAMDRGPKKFLAHYYACVIDIRDVRMSI